MSNVTENFPYPTLTKVHGPLDYPILKILEKEVAANAASIQSDLGGGQNGHLGLVKIATVYANVSAIPYLRHIHPGSLNIPVGASHHASTRMLLDHKEQKRVFREMVTIKKSLQNKLSIVIPSKYLKPYWNRHSNTIDSPIPVIFDDLFRQYGRVSPEELFEEDQKIRSLIFDITELIVSLFNDIEDLQ